MRAPFHFGRAEGSHGCVKAQAKPDLGTEDTHGMLMLLPFIYVEMVT
jgi:hypothetical protein